MCGLIYQICYSILIINLIESIPSFLALLALRFLFCTVVN